MSKYLNEKKENAAQMQALVADLETQSSSLVQLNRAKERYTLLLERYKKLEQVFLFHKGIIQNISSGIITIDLEGKITFMNRSALKLMGYEIAEITGKPISVLFADADEGSVVFDQLVRGKRMFESHETRLLSSDQKIIPIGFSTTIQENADDDDYEGIIIIFRDITEINNFRRQIERMERQSTLGELAAGIAHEIRNPLAGIKTSAQVLEESFSPGDHRSQLVTRIVKEIDRSNELLKRFFNFTKPNKPKQEFHHIRHIVDGVYLLMASRMRKKKISYDARFDDDLPNIFVDEGQIEQVVLNLFLNALDAMQNGGTLTVTASKCSDVRFQEDRYVKSAVSVKITDTGVGIPPDKQEKIFIPFYTSKSDGLGLGLSISSRLLEENNAKVEVESEPGKGSTFSLFFPVEQIEN